MTQEEFERAVFESFSEAASLGVKKDSINNRKPPEPDIVCTIEGRGEVGFELTELIDQSYMKRISLMFHTRNYLNSYWQSQLSKLGSKEFLEKYSGALIYFDYSQSARMIERQKVMPIAFKLLLELDDPEGLQFERHEKLYPILQSINIDQLDIEGPLIDVSSYGTLGDPTLEAIKKKCAKTYKCDYPIELIAHIESNLLPPDDIWLPTVEIAALAIDESHFERMWVYDRNTDKIKYSYP